MTDLRQMQLEILKMMADVDRLLSENGIRYSLLGGSVLGAVRHKGFIPWDDDMDIGILRADFDNAETLLSQLKPYQYEYAEEHIIPDAPIGHIHFVNDKYRIQNSPTIDVFALDKIPDDKRKWRRLRILANIHHLAVLGRAPEHRGNVNKLIFTLFFKLIPKKILHFLKTYTLQRITANNKREYNWIGNIFGAYAEKEYFPAEIYTELVRVDFEDQKLPISTEYDTYLTKLYGDYMKPPAKEAQIPKHRSFS